MKLYLISQSINNSYDTYDSAVVAARNEIEAARIHPGDYSYKAENNIWGFGTGGNFYAQTSHGTWVTHPEQVDVKLIGTASRGTKAGIICASFNAG